MCGWQEELPNTAEGMETAVPEGRAHTIRLCRVRRLGELWFALPSSSHEPQFAAKRTRNGGFRQEEPGKTDKTQPKPYYPKPQSLFNPSPNPPGDRRTAVDQSR
jgi:hypothetical protein